MSKDKKESKNVKLCPLCGAIMTLEGEDDFKIAYKCPNCDVSGFLLNHEAF